jgi:hypothetical protein
LKIKVSDLLFIQPLEYPFFYFEDFAFGASPCAGKLLKEGAGTNPLLASPFSGS